MLHVACSPCRAPVESLRDNKMLVCAACRASGAVSLDMGTPTPTRRLRAVFRATQQPQTPVNAATVAEGMKAAAAAAAAAGSGGGGVSDGRSSICATSCWSQVSPIVVQLRNAAERGDPLPGTNLVSRETVIRQLEPRDADAYVAFNKRLSWRESWHYPMRNEDDARAIAEHRDRGDAAGNMGGVMWLVLVETRREEYGGKAYTWDEIWGEGWYKWRVGEPHSTFGMCVSTAFQGSGAGRALLSRVLQVADTTDIGPSTMRLTVQDINVRAWRLYESLGFVRLPELTTTIPVRTSLFFAADARKSPPMENWHYERHCRRSGEHT
jgi:ribosomal protein S18 acetylase RimI-like enzyme